MTNRLTPYSECLILRILLAEKRVQHPHAFSPNPLPATFADSARWIAALQKASQHFV